MFDKKDDKLFDFAFGELDAHDAQVFEAALLGDESTRAEVEFLRTMKGDLASFRDIPEMQYSKERLRSAILERGLKPKKPTLRWINWLLAPTAVAGVFALGMVLMNGTSPKNTVFIPGNSKPVASNTKPDFNPNLTKSNEPRVAAKTDVPTGTGLRATTVRGIERPISRHSDDSSPRVSREEMSELASNIGQSTAIAVGSAISSGKRENANVATAKAGFDNIRDMNTMKGTGGVGGGGGLAGPGGISETYANNDAFKVAFANTNIAVGDTEAKLIVIDKDQDSGVGAAVATEVNSTTNVPIGG